MNYSLGQRWDRALNPFKLKGFKEVSLLRIHLYRYKGGKIRFAAIKKVKQYCVA